MNPEMLIKMNKALEAGVISKEEYDHVLAQEIKSERQVPVIDAHSKNMKQSQYRFFDKKNLGLYAIVLIIGLIASFLGTGITGFVSQEQMSITDTNIIVNESTSIPLDFNNIDSFYVVGSLTEGSADIQLRVGDESFLVYQGNSSEKRFEVYTDKEVYLINDTVNITILPFDSGYTLWLNTPSGDKLPVNNGFIVNELGSYTLDALIFDDENVIKSSISFEVGETEKIREFNIDQIFFDECGATCSLKSTGDATLFLEINTTGTVKISQLKTTIPDINEPPVLVSAIPDLVVDGALEVDLSEYFADVDSELSYEINNMVGVEETIIGSILRLTGNISGDYETYIYASDSTNLIQSNVFTVTVIGSEPIVEEDIMEINITNETVQEETVIVDVVENVPVIETTLTGCEDPNPNNRPASCTVTEEYIIDENIRIENLDRKPVAKITPIGNLLITGEVIENSDSKPGSRDYRIGYVNRDGQSVATIWIDRSGNLHLIGKLYEENGNLNPIPGSYSLINKRSIFMAWADTVKGDLHVRGNVIPYRKPEVILE